jgi:hypothetical protein
VPPIAREARTIKRIAAELVKLARILRNYPPGEGATRTPEPARAIVRSLKKVNATLAAGARRRSLAPAGFRTIGREFEKIGETLVAVGSASKRRATKTTRKTTRKTTKKKTTRR